MGCSILMVMNMVTVDTCVVEKTCNRNRMNCVLCSKSTKTGVCDDKRILNDLRYSTNLYFFFVKSLKWEHPKWPPPDSKYLLSVLALQTVTMET